MGSEQSRFWLGKLKETHITKPDLHGLCRHLELNSKLPGQAAADVLRFSLEALALVVLSAEFIIYSSFSGYGNRLCAENDADPERNAKSVPAPDNYQFTEETKIVKKGMQ